MGTIGLSALNSSDLSIRIGSLEAAIILGGLTSSLKTLSYSARSIITSFYVTHVSILSSVSYKIMKHYLI